jgi:ATP-binding cassette subfamily F protein 3
MLILDEPTNHLDVDTREALIQALNDYEGAVVLVSHDRHMLELTADRLVLVDGGTAKEFAGTLDEYTDFVLGKTGGGNGAGGAATKSNKKEDRRAAAEARERSAGLRKTVKDAEAEIARYAERRKAIDLAMFDPKAAAPSDARRSMTELMKERALTEEWLAAAEARWLEATEALEAGQSAAA